MPGGVWFVINSLLFLAFASLGQAEKPSPLRMGEDIAAVVAWDLKNSTGQQLYKYLEKKYPTSADQKYLRERKAELLENFKKLKLVRSKWRLTLSYRKQEFSVDFSELREGRLRVNGKVLPKSLRGSLKGLATWLQEHHRVKSARFSFFSEAHAKENILSIFVLPTATIVSGSWDYLVGASGEALAVKLLDSGIVEKLECKDSEVDGREVKGVELAMSNKKAALVSLAPGPVPVRLMSVRETDKGDPSHRFFYNPESPGRSSFLGDPKEDLFPDKMRGPIYQAKGFKTYYANNEEDREEIAKEFSVKRFLIYQAALECCFRFRAGRDGSCEKKFKMLKAKQKATSSGPTATPDNSNGVSH